MTSTLFESSPIGADTELTTSDQAFGAGSIDLSVGETETITFDMTDGSSRSDQGVFTASLPVVGSLIVTNSATGLYTFTITQAQWVAADSPAVLGLHMRSDSDFSSADYRLSITCFAAGTAIATPDGDASVETLQIGDLIRTHDGRDVAVKWVGRQAVNVAMAEVAERHQLVRIAAGALGDGLPLRDLQVTGDHALYLGGMLVNASALVALPGVDFVPLAETGAEYTVYHIELDTHELILAEGSATESFCDAATRAGFDNYDEYIGLYGTDRIIGEMSYPRIGSARLLPASLVNARQTAKAA